MAHFPKLFFKNGRDVWYVEINRKQRNLGPDKVRYHALTGQPRRQKVTSESFAAISDALLEWVSENLAEDTFEWYRGRLQRFIDKYPDTRAMDLRPFHVETWADDYQDGQDYQISQSTRGDYFRGVKRCMKWAKQQGYIDSNPIANMEMPDAGHKEVDITQEELDRLRHRCQWVDSMRRDSCSRPIFSPQFGLVKPRA